MSLPFLFISLLENHAWLQCKAYHDDNEHDDVILHPLHRHKILSSRAMQGWKVRLRICQKYSGDRDDGHDIEILVHRSCSQEQWEAEKQGPWWRWRRRLDFQRWCGHFRWPWGPFLICGAIKRRLALWVRMLWILKIFDRSSVTWWLNWYNSSHSLTEPTLSQSLDDWSDVILITRWLNW